MLPAWADILILAALPVIVLAAVWIWGEDEPDNAIVHTSGEEDREQDPGDLAIVRRIAA